MMLFFISYINSTDKLKMPARRRRNGRKSKFVTKRGLPFQLMKYAETKYNDEGVLDRLLTNPATLGVQFESIVSIGTGNTVNTRVGNIIQVSGFYGRCIYESTLTGQMQYIRICIVTPRDVNNANVPIVDMVTPIDPELHKIWYDKTVPCPFVPGGGHGVLTFRKKFKPYMKTIFDSSVAASVQQGALNFCILTKNDGGATASWCVRTYFKDL